MVKKKSVRKKQRSSAFRSRKKSSLKGELIKTVGGLIALVLLVVAVGMLIRYSPVRRPPVPVTESTVKRRPVTAPEKSVTVHKVPVRQQTDHRSPQFEVFPEKEIPHYKPTEPLSVPVPQKSPQVAIIIDDLGYDSAMADKFAGLDAVLTFSVLPYSPFYKKIAVRARGRGHDVMLHLPMEPLEYPKVDPGPGALLMAMSPDELIRRLQEDLDSMPHVNGVNNHMGSRMTAASDRMNQVFSVLKQRNLFSSTAGQRPQPFPFSPPACFKSLLPSGMYFWIMCRTRRTSAGNSKN